MVKMKRVTLRPLKIIDLFDIYVNIRDKRVTQWTRPPATIIADKKFALYF